MRTRLRRTVVPGAALEDTDQGVRKLRIALIICYSVCLGLLSATGGALAWDEPSDRALEEMQASGKLVSLWTRPPDGGFYGASIVCGRHLGSMIIISPQGNVAGGRGFDILEKDRGGEEILRWREVGQWDLRNIFTQAYPLSFEGRRVRIGIDVGESGFEMVLTHRATGRVNRDKCIGPQFFSRDGWNRVGRLMLEELPQLR